MSDDWKDVTSDSEWTDVPDSQTSTATESPIPDKTISQRIQDGLKDGTNIILQGISNAPSEGMLNAIAGGPANNISQAVKQIALDRAIPGKDLISSSIKGAIKEGTNPVNVFQGLAAIYKPTKIGVTFPTSSQVDEASSLVDDNLANLKRVNGEQQFRLSDEINTTKIKNKIIESNKLSKLENQKSNTAYSQAEAIHGDPVEARGGDVGLGLKASKNLNKAYWAEAEPLMKKELFVEDIRDGIKTTLQKSGVVDGSGNPIPNAEMSPDHTKLLNFYNSLAEKETPGVINALGDVRKITAGELKGKLESSFGKTSGGSNLVRDTWAEAAQYVDEIKDLNAKYVTDYQARNGVFDKFNIFNKLGWRKGDVSLKSGSDLLKNLAHEDASQINRDSLKLMDFIKKYTGVDPSEPVVSIGNDIKGINQTAASRDISDKIRMQNLDRNIFDIEKVAGENARATKESLAKLKLSALVKEAKASYNKKVKIAVGLTAAATIGGPAVHKTVKKVLPFIP